MADEIVEVKSAAEIAERVKELAWDITQAYEGQDFTILGVLDDSFIFLADLLRAINHLTRTAFLRYDHQSIGGVQDISFSTQVDLSRRDVLLVEVQDRWRGLPYLATFAHEGPGDVKKD
ncbi:MAG: hypothetical protein DMF68_21695 [Acidobacteria bacterium]|nr:MAG: hypothetical protein DMF68_21695 [Acidobacteriota bacterium]